MNFTPAQLSPSQTGFQRAKSVAYRMPHTPFWNDPAFNADRKTRSFHGNYFFLQNKRTFEVEEDLPSNPEEGRFVADDPICGFAAYSISTTVDYGPSSDPSDGTLERMYVFDETLNEVRLETVETGNHFGLLLGNTRTATTRIHGNQYADPAVHLIETFTGAVDKTTLENYMDEWRGKPEEFRSHTAAGFGNEQGATKSESDGYLAKVGGGDVRALPYTFTEFSSSGMTGDIAALWNGNFTADVAIVTRKNFPVIHREESENDSYVRNFKIGTAIYSDGYSEEQLSEPLTSWRDDYGIFETGEELDDAPLVAVSGDRLGILAPPVNGQGNDFFLVSRDGNQYRVTLEYGNTTYDYDEEGWETLGTEVIVTGETTLQSPAITVVMPEGAYSVRVGKIERKEGADWVTVADVANGDAPGHLISTSVRSAGALLFVVSRSRRGNRWGHLPFSGGGETRYRVKTYKLHLTPGTVTLSGGSCGGDVTGNLDLEWTDEFDAVTGLPKERLVTQWEVVINGSDWTPEQPEAPGFYGNIVTDTATLFRREVTAELAGRFIVAFDEPSPNGKIISTATVNAPVSFTGGINVGSEVALLPPASGRSVFFEGFRLRL